MRKDHLTCHVCDKSTCSSTSLFKNITVRIHKKRVDFGAGLYDVTLHWFHLIYFFRSSRYNWNTVESVHIHSQLRKCIHVIHARWKRLLSDYLLKRIRIIIILHHKPAVLWGGSTSATLPLRRFKWLNNLMLNGKNQFEATIIWRGLYSCFIDLWPLAQNT